MRSWQLQEAKSRFSHVIELAIADSPQLITRNGKPVAYIISTEAYEDLKKPSIKSTLLNQPHKDLNISWDRNKELPRDIDL